MKDYKCIVYIIPLLFNVSHTYLILEKIHFVSVLNAHIFYYTTVSVVSFNLCT